ncbi:MAG: type II secretion system F family protein [Rhodoglobus sp.]
MKRSEPGIAAVAVVVQRLAVLLAAGVPPAPAWRYVAESSASGIPRAVSQAVVDSTGIPDAIIGSAAHRPVAERTAWSGLAAAWAVATDAGAPLAPCLREFAASLRDLAQVQRDIEVALSGPASTARVVMILPFVGLLFGVALGFDTMRTLFTTPIGIGCLVVGGGLIAAAQAWNRKLVRSAQPTETTPGLECELTAIAVSGGGALDAAVAAVAAAMQRFDVRGAGGVDEALDLSRRAGVPAADLLRSAADEARRDARAAAQVKAESLGVRLMLPLGLCILPAFMVLGVLPLLVTVITSTVAQF